VEIPVPGASGGGDAGQLLRMAGAEHANGGQHRAVGQHLDVVGQAAVRAADQPMQVHQREGTGWPTHRCGQQRAKQHRHRGACRRHRKHRRRGDRDP
jgi:hypothetical protein